MKSTFSVILFLLLFYSSYSQIYKDVNQPVEKRVEDLLSKMSLEEKVYLLEQESDTLKMGNISFGKIGFLDSNKDPKIAAENYNKIQKYLKTKTKYGIPTFKSGEGIFAYMGYKSTAFPQPLAQAATFDENIVAKVAHILSEEFKSRGVRWIFSPVLNIGRDPRWGRTGETYGEDPYLISKMGISYVKTVESKGIVTTLKHFAGNTGHDGKFGSASFYSERYLREYEFPPYEAAFKEGGSKSVMMAYNTSDAIACTQSEWMMNKVIKGEWKMDGIIMSDGGGMELVHQSYGIDSTPMLVAAKSMNAGCDLALSPRDAFYGKPLIEAIKNGLVSEKTLDESVRRYLRQVFRTGLYDNPYTNPEYAETINDCAEHRKAALEVALKTMVLLKNQNNILPFSKEVKNIFVTGPLADKLLINHYGGYGRKEVTVLEGLKNMLPNAHIQYEKGAEVGFTFFPSIETQYLFTENNGKKVNGLNGEYFDNTKFQGSPSITQIDPNIDFNWKYDAPKGLKSDKFSIRWTGKLKVPASGRYTFGAHADDELAVYIDGEPIVDMKGGTTNALFVEKGNIYLEKDKEYEIKAEYVENAQKAYAKLGWDANLFAKIPETVEQAKKSDIIIAVVGSYDDENGDRAILNLDDAQEQLIIELSKLNKPMVVVLQSGNVITMRRWIDKVPAVLEAWYPGEEGGNAIVKTLFGDNNPSGKLPITIPKETGQVPLTYNRFPGKDTKAIDRGIDRFWDVGNEPQFCFGFGLSYTQFEYSNMKLSTNQMKSTDSIKVSIDIKNVGKREGEEIVQLYIHDEYASVSRPIKELKGFKKVSLKPNETQTLNFKITPKELQFFDINMKRVVEPGDFKIMIGASSDDIKFTETLKVVR